jgi:hypothetical protein
MSILGKFVTLGKPLIRRSYYLTRAYQSALFLRDHREKKDGVIIYQMGKVGSSTVLESLKNSGLDKYLFHVHVLTPKWIKRVEATYKNVSRVNRKAIIDGHLIASLYLRRRLDRNSGEKWKVISLVRDPVARNISSFFEAFDRYFPELDQELKKSGEPLENHIDRLVDTFLGGFNHQTPLIWFDEHFRPVFDIDVYASDFPKSRGYEIYRGGKADLLLLRVENLNTCHKEAFREFLGIRDFELVFANVSQNKRYFSAYKKFMRQIKLPDEYLDRMYNSQFARYFYSSEEIAAFRGRWAQATN